MAKCSSYRFTLHRNMTKACFKRLRMRFNFNILVFNCRIVYHIVFEKPPWGKIIKDVCMYLRQPTKATIKPSAVCVCVELIKEEEEQPKIRGNFVHCSFVLNFILTPSKMMAKPT